LSISLDQRLHLGVHAQAGEVAEGHVVVLRELLDVLLVDHDQHQVR
jgi:hypothetical protein